MRNTPYILGAVGILGFSIISVSTALRHEKIEHTTPEQSALISTSSQAIEGVHGKVAPFADINLTAKAAYVYDARMNRALFTLHEEDPLPLASVTKIMTIITALSYLRTPEYVVSIALKDLETEGDSGLVAEERWKLSDLAAYTLMTSSNDGAVALARSTEEATGKSWSELTMEMAKQIGLSQSYFLNPSGLDESSNTSGSYGSARDVALMLAYGINNYRSIFEYTGKQNDSFTSLSGIQHEAKNTNTTVGNSIGIVASKTGTTDLAGGNLVIAFEAGPSRPIIISLLQSTPKDRFTEMAQLAEASINALAQQ